MKKNAKRILSAVLCLCLAAPSLFGCASGRDDGELNVLCTVFPVYDWVRGIVGDTEGVEVSLLVENGTDLHSFQPSFSDMAKIKNADVVIYVGGESDKWVSDSVADDAEAIALSELDGMSLYSISSEYIAEGHEHGEEHEHDHEESFDEHLWLSVRNAAVACGHISETLCRLDGDNADVYERNTSEYTARLAALDTRLAALCESADTPLIFADRFPFVYLFRDYGLEYYAAFDGCTTDTNADFDTVIRLAARLDETNGKYVLITESPTEGLAEQVIESSTAKSAGILTLNSMQSQGIGSEETYLSIMEGNVAVLEKIFKTED